MKFKGIFSVLVIACMILSILAGCGATTGATKDTSVSQESTGAITEEVSTTQASDLPAEKVTLTGMVQNGMWNKGMDAVVAAAEAKIGVKVEMQILPDGSQGEQVIKTKYASNDVTDLLFYWAGATVAVLNPEKNFLDISKESFVENVPDVLKYPLSYKGVLYGVPLASSGVGLCGMFYNKKVFSNLKLEIPKTYSEFLKLCETIKAAGNVTPVYYSCKDAWSAQLLPMISGWSYCVKDDPEVGEKISTNKLKFADISKFVASFDKLKELKDKGYINKDYLAATYDNAQKALALGEAAMYPMGSWVMSPIAEKFPEQVNDIGAFGFPDDDGDVWIDVLGTGGVYINNSSKNIDATKKWVSFYTTPEGASEYYKISRDIPVFKGVTAELFGATEDLNKYYVDGKAALAFTNLVPFELVGFDKICVEVLVSGKSSLDLAKQQDMNCEKDAKAKGIQGF